MPEYAYHAVDRQGRSTNGTMVAENERALERRLTDIGYWLIDAKVLAARKAQKRHSVPRRELIEFFNDTSALLVAGIPIAEAISDMAEETTHPALKHILEDIGLNVQSGKQVSESFSIYPNVFPEQITNLVLAGEQGGNLTETFKDISEHMEWVDKTVKDVKQASIYPIMIILAVAGLIGIMFTVVVPSFAELFTELELELPPLTQAVVSIGEFAKSYWWALLLGIGISAGAIKFMIAKHSGFRYKLDELKLRAPVLGEVFNMLAQSHFVHNLGLMLKAGMPIIDALKLCRGLADNLVMDKAIVEAEDSVRRGDRMSEALRRHDIISSLTLRMIVVGEESGQLDKTLEQAATRFDDEIPRRIKRVFAILEPIITLCLVAMVGLIAAAVFLPMFSLMSGLGI